MLTGAGNLVQKVDTRYRRVRSLTVLEVNTSVSLSQLHPSFPSEEGGAILFSQLDVFTKWRVFS